MALAVGNEGYIDAPASISLLSREVQRCEFIKTMQQNGQQRVEFKANVGLNFIVEHHDEATRERVSASSHSNSSNGAHAELIMSPVHCGDAVHIGSAYGAFVNRSTRHAIHAQGTHGTDWRMGLAGGRHLCLSFILCTASQKTAAADRRAAVCKVLKETGMETNEGGAIRVHDVLVARSLRNNPIPQCILDKLDLRARNVLFAAREFLIGVQFIHVRPWHNVTDAIFRIFFLGREITSLLRAGNLHKSQTLFQIGTLQRAEIVAANGFNEITTWMQQYSLCARQTGFVRTFYSNLSKADTCSAREIHLF